MNGRSFLCPLTVKGKLRRHVSILEPFVTHLCNDLSPHLLLCVDGLTKSFSVSLNQLTQEHLQSNTWGIRVRKRERESEKKGEKERVDRGGIERDKKSVCMMCVIIPG